MRVLLPAFLWLLLGTLSLALTVPQSVSAEPPQAGAKKKGKKAPTKKKAAKK